MIEFKDFREADFEAFAHPIHRALGVSSILNQTLVNLRALGDFVVQIPKRKKNPGYNNRDF